MPWYRMPFHQGGHGDAFHLHLGSKRNKTAPRPCCVCGWISERECDWVVNAYILIHGKPKTCDAPLCAHCTHSPASNKDICPQHVGPLKAWFAGRTNSTEGEGP